MTICPSCRSTVGEPFYVVGSIPTNSCLLLSDREAALRFQAGKMRLCFCGRCGFIFNAAYHPELTIYSEEYEETQGFSPTFNKFSRSLAERLIERHELYGKDIVEIGCGKGEFLTLLCRLGRNRGVGYDPSFVPERQERSGADVRFVREFFTAETRMPAADLVCCKMTFEHIHETGSFVRTLHDTIGDRQDTIVFFQVPNVLRILEDAAFWDVYYEHCSYFCAGSLAHLFQQAGFDVLDVWTGYDDQYLMIEARPRTGTAERRAENQDAADLADLSARVRSFAERTARKRDAWSHYLQRVSAEGRKALLWGSGSKAVSFLTTLGLRNEIDCVVDINPYRWHRYMPGTGQRIIAPEEVPAARPDVVIIMNPVYREEIGRELAALGCTPEILTVLDPVNAEAESPA